MEQNSKSVFGKSLKKFLWVKQEPTKRSLLRWEIRLLPEPSLTLVERTLIQRSSPAIELSDRMEGWVAIQVMEE